MYCPWMWTGNSAVVTNLNFVIVFQMTLYEDLQVPVVNSGHYGQIQCVFLPETPQEKLVITKILNTLRSVVQTPKALNIIK